MDATRNVWLLLAVALGGYLLYLLAPILTPFLISALLAYVASPLIARLERVRVPRALGVALLFVLLLGLALALTLVLVPVMQRQILAFAAKLPGYLDWLETRLGPWLASVTGDAVPALDLAALKDQLVAHWRELGGLAGRLWGGITQSGARLVGWLVNLALIPVVTFYLLRDWDRILERIAGILPARLRTPVTAMARETDEVLAAFLRGQLTVMVALALIYSVGLWLIGLDLALPIGLLAGLVSFVPYLGFIIGILAAGLAALLQFHDAFMLLWVAAVFGVGQALESTVLTPNLVGDRIGLHPVAVIFALLAGGQLFGFFGVLLALPAAAAIVVWLRHLHRGLSGTPPRTRRARPASRS
jgi:predicted PurR-regulated permease PerM